MSSLLFTTLPLCGGDFYQFIEGFRSVYFYRFYRQDRINEMGYFALFSNIVIVIICIFTALPLDEIQLSE